MGVDIDGDPLTYAWSDDCGGSFTAPRSARTAWSKGSTGACTVTVTVRDPRHTASGSVELSVSARGDGSIRVEGAFVPRPVLRQLGVCRVVLPGMQCVGPYASLDPTRPTPIEGTHFKDSLSIQLYTSDVELPYEGPRDGGSWTGDGGTPRVAPAVSSVVDDCGGRYEALPQEDSWRFAGVWTAPSAADGGPVLCKLTARVQRGPLSDSFSGAVPVL